MFGLLICYLLFQKTTKTASINSFSSDILYLENLSSSNDFLIIFEWLLNDFLLLWWMFGLLICYSFQNIHYNLEN